MTARTTLAAVRFEIELLEPGGITTPAPTREGAVDAVIDTDPWGQPLIPGTSLAGALRSRITAHHGPTRATAWFGAVLRDGTSTTATASPLWVLNAPRTGKERAPTDRWTTAIDPRRGAAANRTLRGVEILPAGTTFTAALLWQDATVTEVDELVDALTGWRPLLGRSTSAGRGRAAIRNVHHGILDLRTPAGLLTWTQRYGHDLADTIATNPAGTATEAADGSWWRIRLHLNGPLLVSTDQDEGPGTRRRKVPLSQDGAPVIPGTSLKGVLRARISYILRSVGADACLDRSCGNCLPCRYFGYAGGHHQDETSVGRRGSARVLDSRMVGNLHTRTTTHVAIDRFTGGSAARTPTDERVHESNDRGGLLYTVTAVDRGEFDLAVDVTDVPVADRPVLAALLRLALQDLHDGLIGIGYGTTRGYGGVRLAPTVPDLPSLPEAKTVLRQVVSSPATSSGGQP